MWSNRPVFHLSLTKNGSDDLLAQLVRQLGARPGSLMPVNRLDRPVSGLVVIAKTAAAQTALTRQMGERLMDKYYLAVVCGKPEPAEGQLTDFLIKNERLNRSRVAGPGQSGAKQAQLAYRLIAEPVLAEETVLSLLRIELLTGRHHQIRVQAAHAGWPLWGDTKYNPVFQRAGGWHDVALLAAGLSFRHPASGKKLTFELPLPEQYPFNFFPTVKTEFCDTMME